MLGPSEGRYLLRDAGDPPSLEARGAAPGDAGEPAGAPPSHVLVLAVMGAPQRRFIGRGRKQKAQPEADPAPVATTRATIVDVGHPLTGADEAAQWLAAAGETELAADLAVLNRALHAFRLVIADPYVNPVGRHQAVVTRIGYGGGEEVADGLWTDARELTPPAPRQRRAKILQPQARLAAVLTGRERALACEGLTLAARLDLEQGREREAALQLHVALDAALAELPGDAAAPALEDRLDDLRSRREAVAQAAQAALAGPLAPEERETVELTLGRIEAALRARAVANA